MKKWLLSFSLLLVAQFAKAQLAGLEIQLNTRVCVENELGADCDFPPTDFLSPGQWFQYENETTSGTFAESAVGAKLSESQFVLRAEASGPADTLTAGRGFGLFRFEPEETITIDFTVMTTPGSEFSASVWVNNVFMGFPPTVTVDPTDELVVGWSYNSSPTGRVDFRFIASFGAFL